MMIMNGLANIIIFIIRVKFENETPISIVFSNDIKSILIGTSIRNQYKSKNNIKLKLV